ncbi:hypothetical protein ACFPRL_24085 [Pseudoclavibacter helvolus]
MEEDGVLEQDTRFCIRCGQHTRVVRPVAVVVLAVDGDGPDEDEVGPGPGVCASLREAERAGSRPEVEDDVDVRDGRRGDRIIDPETSDRVGASCVHSDACPAAAARVREHDPAVDARGLDRGCRIGGGRDCCGDDRSRPGRSAQHGAAG